MVHDLIDYVARTRRRRRRQNGFFGQIETVAPHLIFSSNLTSSRLGK